MAAQLLRTPVCKARGRSAKWANAPARPALPFSLTIQELRLLNSFRGIPDDERRNQVLEALETFHTAYT